MDKTELLKKKEEIEELKTSISEKKGELKGKMKTMSENYGVKTLAEAKAKIKTLDTKSDDLAEQIREKTEELETKYFSDEK